MMNTITLYFFNFTLNFVAAFLMVRFIYYPIKRNKKYVFTFLAFNTVIFFLMSLLGRVELSIGVGFSLFAIFSVLRYRTNTIPIREMTYLFAFIALPVMNSILLNENSYLELLVANLLCGTIFYLLEREWGFQYEAQKSITYEKIELVKPENQLLLLADLQERTGLTINHLEVGDINFKRQTAEIRIYYNQPSPPTRSLSHETSRLTSEPHQPPAFPAQRLPQPK